MVGSALADGSLHRRHDALHQRRAESACSSGIVTPSLGPEETCGCTTKVITVWGSPTLVSAQPSSTAAPEETTTLTSTVHSTSTSTQTVTVTPSVEATSEAAAISTPVASPSTSTIYVNLPTASVVSFSSTGVYTIPATTLTVSESTTVCGATSTEVPSGTHTIGGVTTVVETSTTVVCPYATVKTTGTTVTSVLETTTYVCPSAGTYTVVPGTTTTVPSSTVIVYPTPETFTPGTYTQSESVVTVTRTDYTYVCPFATSAASTTTAIPATSAVPTTSSVGPVVAATSSPSSTSAAAATSRSSSNTGLTGEGQYAMTFTPFVPSNGQCMTSAQIADTIKNTKEKGFNVIRVYSSVDCDGTVWDATVAAVKANGLKMILGIYITDSGVSGAQDQVTKIVEWADWSLVELVVVGNEAISDNYCTASDLAAFITSTKTAFKNAGYTGQVTTTEPVDIWQEYGASTLCSVVDVIGANIHPFFNSATTAAEAGSFVLSEVALLKNICSDSKDVLNLETGWPTAGTAEGAAVPSVANQEIAIKAIVKAYGSKSTFFSYGNDLWKNTGDVNSVERYWGCINVF